MVIEPKMRGFICTTAHPVGCAANVQQQIDYVKQNGKISGARRVLVIGCSAGYGMASRITSAFGCGADTIGISFERPSSGKRTATAGWYNNRAFEKAALAEGLVAETIDGDAYTDEVKQLTIQTIKEKMPDGKIDLIIYSLAAPKCTDPDTGKTHSSVIQPIGSSFTGKTVDFHTGEVSNVTVQPATEEQIEDTIAVMGGADWLRWIKQLNNAGVLDKGAATVAFSYLGPELTHAVYKDGTIGRAKIDLEQKQKQIDSLLASIGGKAFVSVNKALVTQASAAIPVVPLYISLLYKIMKEINIHEDCIQQMVRMYECRLAPANGIHWNLVPVDTDGRIRMDDWEMRPQVQQTVRVQWDSVTTQTVESVTDLAGYRSDFYKLFGFGIDGVDYTADIAEY